MWLAVYMQLAKFKYCTDGIMQKWLVDLSLDLNIEKFLKTLKQYIKLQMFQN